MNAEVTKDKKQKVISNKLVKLVAGVAVSGALFATPVQAKIKFDTGVVVGLDDNPHELSERFGTRQEEYYTGDFRLRADYDRTFYLIAGAEKSLYINDDRADYFKANVQLMVKSDFKIFGEKFKYRINATQKNNDETYVSKRTGLVATFGGESIANRYDFEISEYSAQLSYKNDRNAVFGLRIEQREKDYEDFEIANLDDLDYEQTLYAFDVDFNVDDKGKFFLEGEYIEREYLDRRSRDALGADIIDSDLKYFYAQVSAGYLYRPDKDTRWKYTFHYSARTDNGGGYYNSDYSYLSIYTKYEMATYHTLRARLKFGVFTYDNQLDRDLISLEDENKERVGGSFKIDYEWVLWTLFDSNLGFYIEAEAKNFTSTDVDYSYARNRVAAGVRWTL